MKAGNLFRTWQACVTGSDKLAVQVGDAVVLLLSSRVPGVRGQSSCAVQVESMLVFVYGLNVCYCIGLLPLRDWIVLQREQLDSFLV